MIAALYVQTNGVYFGLPNVDPWDIRRDATAYRGPWPVVAHPPCERWSKCAHIHKDKPGRALGDDGGCFAHALNAVHLWGGVLEHPAGSAAWRHFGIPAPGEGAWGYGWQLTVRGGWSCVVDQGHYGHRSRKLTWLYWFAPRGGLPPSLVTGLSDKPALVQSKLGKKARSATPIPFRDVLIAMAESAAGRRAA